MRSHRGSRRSHFVGGLHVDRRRAAGRDLGQQDDRRHADSAAAPAGMSARSSVAAPGKGVATLLGVLAGGLSARMGGRSSTRPDMQYADSRAQSAWRHQRRQALRSLAPSGSGHNQGKITPRPVLPVGPTPVQRFSRQSTRRRPDPDASGRRAGSPEATLEDRAEVIPSHARGEEVDSVRRCPGEGARALGIHPTACGGASHSHPRCCARVPLPLPVAAEREGTSVTKSAFAAAGPFSSSASWQPGCAPEGRQPVRRGLFVTASSIYSGRRRLADGEAARGGGLRREVRGRRLCAQARYIGRSRPTPRRRRQVIADLRRLSTTVVRASGCAPG